MTDNETPLVVVPCFHPGDWFEYHMATLASHGLRVLLVNNDPQHPDRVYAAAAQHGFLAEENSFGPTYEAGALLHAYEHHDFSRVILLQDSMLLKDPRPLLLNSKITAFVSITPANHGMAPWDYAWMEAHFPNLSGLSTHPGFQYNCFAADRSAITDLIGSEILIPEHLPRDKAGSCGWERVFGLAFHRLGYSLKFLAPMFSTHTPWFEKILYNRA